MTDKPPTHMAFALRRETRARSRWIEIGHGATDKVRCPNCDHRFPFSGVHHAVLDRLPTGGFSGHVTFSPVGARPVDPEPKPERPENGDDT
jgi:hypothetical protein